MLSGRYMRVCLCTWVWERGAAAVLWPRKALRQRTDSLCGDRRRNPRSFSEQGSALSVSLALSPTTQTNKKCCTVPFFQDEDMEPGCASSSTVSVLSFRAPLLSTTNIFGWLWLITDQQGLMAALTPVPIFHQSSTPSRRIAVDVFSIITEFTWKIQHGDKQGGNKGARLWCIMAMAADGGQEGGRKTIHSCTTDKSHHQAKFTPVIAKHPSASGEHIVFAVKRPFTPRVKLTLLIYTALCAAQRKISLPAQHPRVHNIGQVITAPDLLYNKSSRGSNTLGPCTFSVHVGTRFNTEIELRFILDLDELQSSEHAIRCLYVGVWASCGFVVSDFRLPKPQAASGLSLFFFPTEFG